MVRVQPVEQMHANSRPCDQSVAYAAPSRLLIRALWKPADDSQVAYPTAAAASGALVPTVRDERRSTVIASLLSP